MNNWKIHVNNTNALATSTGNHQTRATDCNGWDWQNWHGTADEKELITILDCELLALKQIIKAPAEKRADMLITRFVEMCEKSAKIKYQKGLIYSDLAR